MTKPPSELFSPDRPIRSDFARRSSTSYALRRMVTLTVLTAALIGGGSWMWGRLWPSTPGEVPTVKTDGSYKQRPDEPGGIDIPHQDVQVYHEIDGSAAYGNAKPAIEHMLPPPEVPNVVSAPASSVDTDNGVPAKPESLMQANNVDAAAGPAAPVLSPAPAQEEVVIQAPAPVVIPPVVTVPTVVPAPVVPPVASVPLKTELPKKVAPAAKAIKSVPIKSGNTIIQLASSVNEAAAKTKSQELQSKYQKYFGDAPLHMVRANLGAKGIFYRIQSPPMLEAQAKSICDSIKSSGGGCILVHH